MKRIFMLLFFISICSLSYAYDYIAYEGTVYDYEERKPLKIEIASTDGKLLIRSDGTGFLSDFVKDTIFIINDSTKTVSALSISVLDGLAKSLSGMMQKSDEDSFEYHMKPMEGTFASAGHIGREYKIALSKDENVHIYLDEKTDISRPDPDTF